MCSSVFVELVSQSRRRRTWDSSYYRLGKVKGGMKGPKHRVKILTVSAKLKTLSTYTLHSYATASAAGPLTRPALLWEVCWLPHLQSALPQAVHWPVGRWQRWPPMESWAEHHGCLFYSQHTLEVSNVINSQSFSQAHDSLPNSKFIFLTRKTGAINCHVEEIEYSSQWISVCELLWEQ